MVTSKEAEKWKTSYWKVRQKATDRKAGNARLSIVSSTHSKCTIPYDDDDVSNYLTNSGI